jgi:hypothetical protein
MTTRAPAGQTTSAPGNYPRKFNKREKKLLETARKDDNVELTFRSQPQWSAVMTNSSGSQAVNPTEANAGDELRFSCEGQEFEEHLSVVESTGTATYNWPYASTSGLEVPLIAANGTNGIQGCELTNGILSTSPLAFTVGSFLKDKIFFEAKIKIDDITDLGQLFVGFRKAEAYQADPDSYDELAAFHVGETGATVADGQINIATILNDAATAYTDTTLTDWADAGEHRLRVEISNSGKCEFFYDGSVPTVTKSFSFDSGEVIVPFLFAEVASASTNGDPGLSITHWKCGYL